jgi:polyferredoxin
LLGYAADALLVVHFLIAAFIVGGLVLVWVGAGRGWRWIRSRAFRLAHVAAIAFVALETLAGYACPLTVWEDMLRGNLRPESFVGRWLHRLLYYSFPEWVFALAYVLWALAAVATLWLVPPKPRR